MNKIKLRIHSWSFSNRFYVRWLIFILTCPEFYSELLTILFFVVVATYIYHASIEFITIEQAIEIFHLFSNPQK